MSAADRPDDARRGRSARRDHARRDDVAARVDRHEYGAFLRWSAIGSLIPGVGLVAAGRRRIGSLIFGLFLLGLVAVVYFTFRSGTSGLVKFGTDPDLLGPVAAGLVAAAALWLVSALASFYALEPEGLRFPQRLFAALVVAVAASVVIAPLSIGARSAFTQMDTINTVFADEDDHSLTVPEDATEEDPWAGKPRVNVLILGADSGSGREGTRTDTVMVASIDTKTGQAALFSLPRNLQYVPFPEDTPMAEEYPDGYHGGEEGEYWLYSMYQNVPAEFPEFFEGVRDPGAEALKLSVGTALGLDLDYYVMVNLRGFQYLVDAFGGIDIDVPYDIPIGTRSIPGVGCSEESGWIREGPDQHLDGYRALWFARARCGPGPVSDDYERMRRQRCVIGAIAQQADPFTLLTRYQQLASATEKTMSTDIPQQRLSAFAELAMKTKDAGIQSLPFTNEIIDYGDPDYELIQDFVQDALKPVETAPPTTPPTDANEDEPTMNATVGTDPTDEATEPSGDESGGEEGTGDEESPPPGEGDGAVDIATVC